LNPSLTRNRIPTVIIPLLEKPDNASSEVMISVAMNMTSAVNRTNPGRIISLRRAMIIRITTAMAIYPVRVSLFNKKEYGQ
jgi:hypothetical protein